MLDERKHTKLCKTEARKRKLQAKGTHHSNNIAYGFYHKQQYKKATHDQQDREYKNAENNIKQQAGDIYKMNHWIAIVVSRSLQRRIQWFQRIIEVYLLMMRIPENSLHVGRYFLQEFSCCKFNQSVDFS